MLFNVQSVTLSEQAGAEMQPVLHPRACPLQGRGNLQFALPEAKAAPCPGGHAQIPRAAVGMPPVGRAWR